MHQKSHTSICLILLVLASAAVAESDPEFRTERITPAHRGTDWPVWSGPEGNLTSLGNGLLDSGPFGLERVWSRPLGSSYSGIVGVDGRLTTTFSDGESDYLVALDASAGTEQWRYRISDTHKGHDGSDDGPLATPSIDNGVVYGLGAWGALFAVSLEDGTERWRRDLVVDFGAVKPDYGFATAPTVIGDLLVVETGGDDGRSISAFDRETGELRWSTGDDPVRYQSPMLLDLGGETMLVAITSRNLLGLAPETGEVLWQHQHTEGDRRGFNSAQPVPVGEGGILLTAGRESALFQVSKNAEGYSVEEAWRSRALRGSFAVPVPYQGFIYGYSGNFLTCVDAATGKMVWKSRPPGEGELMLIDGHLVILARSGEIVIAEATPDAYREVSRVQALDRGYYTRPSFAGGRVYARNLTDISAIAVTQASPAPSGSTERAGTERAGTERAGTDWDLRGEFGAFVKKLAVAENKDERIEGFLAEHPTLPILEGNLVHFVYRGVVDDLAVSGNFIRDGSQHSMHRVEGTDFYFRSYELPEKAIFTYQFSVFDESMTDPANPRKTGPEGREHSVLTTAGWQAPSHLRDPEGARGSLQKLTWKSERLDNERDLQIYLPAGYGEGDDRYPLLVINDGDAALSMGEMDKSLDNLSGKTVAPLIVAFVPSVSGRELRGSRAADYAWALAEELIPLLDETFRTDARRESRAVMGQDPYGGAGFAAMYVVLQHPGVFSKAVAQSYEHGESKEELMAAVSGEKYDLELLFHWSSYDRLMPFWDFDARRDGKSLVAVLEKNGYRPKIFESNDGVGWGMWQGRTAEILEALFPFQ